MKNNFLDKIAECQDALKSLLNDMHHTGTATHWQVVKLAEISVKKEVYWEAIAIVNRTKGYDDAVAEAYIRQEFESKALMTWKPNSTCNISLEMELIKHYTWVELVQEYFPRYSKRLNELAVEFTMD